MWLLVTLDWSTGGHQTPSDSIPEVFLELALSRSENYKIQNLSAVGESDLSRETEVNLKEKSWKSSSAAWSQSFIPPWPSLYYTPARPVIWWFGIG